MTHIKGILPTKSYHCTVRQCIPEDENVRLVWTIDEDTEYAWRNLIDLYPLNEYGLSRLQRTCKSLNVRYPPQGEWGELIGMRALLSVGVRIKGNYRTNAILEYSLPTQPPHIDPTRERSDDHYFENKNPRKLPI